MRLYIAAVSLVVASTAYALDLHRVKNRHKIVAGAAYFMTNQPEGNFIISCDIGIDGKLTYGHALSTGGKGGTAIDPGTPVIPDALASVNSVKVAGHRVFAVNPGSHTLSMFSFKEHDPAKLRMVGRPVNTGGEFPVSVAVSKQSGQVCVLNGGRINGVNCYRSDYKHGLVQLDNTHRLLHLNRTTPPTIPEGSLSQVTFSEDGRHLLALVKGFPGISPGMIMIWDVDTRTGALSKNFKPVHGGIVPFSLSFIPGTNAILSTDPGVGVDIWDFKNGKNPSVKGFPIPGQSEVCWSAFSSKTGNFYLSDFGVGRITEINIDKNLSGTVINQYPQGKGSYLTENNIATINKQDYLYTLAPGVTSVVVLSLDAPGKTTLVQNFSITDAVRKFGISINRNNLEGMGIFFKEEYSN